ncbi:MAG: hypothetical protein QXK37_02065 [Candidatus Woesearchaeota archaeon]
MPQKVLEELLNEIPTDVKEEFDKHLEYHNPETQKKWKYEDWQGFKGGTEVLFENVYQSSTKFVIENQLNGKKDSASIRRILENLIIEALKSSRLQSAVSAAKVLEAAIKAGEFKTDEEVIGHLAMVSSQYLGIDEKLVAQLKAQLETGDKYLALAGIKNFTNSLKDAVINQYISQHRSKIEAGREHHLTAYVIEYGLRGKYNLTPENLGKELSQPPHIVLQKYAQLGHNKDQFEQVAQSLKYKKYEKK